MNRITRLIAALLLAVFTTLSVTAQQTKTQDQPFVVEYYYQTKWGYADEFLRLFRKNHLPVLKKQIESGRMLSVKIEKPRYHSTEDGRWDYRVTIVFKNVAAAHDSTAEEAIIKQLYPDQETFRREEQRRFEILIAHWDVPIVSVPTEQ
ncbi:MAG: hypothetical protein U0Z53_09280 [Blastocatellia bacterium]